MEGRVLKIEAANLTLADSGLHCPQCDYNLTGVQSARCPECGSTIDASLRPDSPAENATQRGLVALLTLIVGLLSCAGAVKLALTPVRGARGPAHLYEGVAFVTGCVHLAVFLMAVRLRLIWPLRASGLSLACALTGAAQIAASVVVVVRQTYSQTEGMLGTAVLLAFFSLPGWVLLVARRVVFRRPRTGVAARSSAGLAVAQAEPAHDAAPFIVDAVGPFERGQVSVRWSDERRPTNALLETLIDETWRDKLASAAANKQHLFNGALVRLIDLKVGRSSPQGQAELRLTVGPSDYRDFVGTNLYNAHLLATLGRVCFSNPVGTTATIITRDGWLLYGRRNDRVAYHAGYLHTFGGGLEPADRDEDGSLDMFAALARELREELKVTDREIGSAVCVGVVRDTQIHQPEVLFDVYVSATRADLLERHHPLAEDQEHAAIEGCLDDPDAIVPFITRAGKIAPVAAAALLLHGRLNWGLDWYEGACYVLYGALPECAPPSQEPHKLADGHPGGANQRP